MNIILVLKSFEKPCLVKTSFTFDQVAKELLIKSINKFSMFGISNEDNERLHLKCDVLLLADIFVETAVWRIMVCVLVIIGTHQLQVGMQCLVWLNSS